MIIDASVWVAAVLEHDQHHKSTLAFIHRLVIRTQTARVPLLAWVEIAGAVARRTGSTHYGLKAAQTLATQPWIQALPLDEALAQEASKLAAHLKLRGADAVYVALAASLNQPLLTLDNEMLERTQGIVNAFTPTQWIERAE